MPFSVASHRLLICIWSFVNAIFLVKYLPLPLYGSLSLSLLLSLFVIVMSSLLQCEKHNHFFSVWGQRLFLLAIVFAVFLHITLLCYIDKMGLAVDRWSALEYFGEALLDGRFPYAVGTHLSNGNTPSPLPVWQLIALPFSLLGDVGLLQTFFLITIALLLHKKVSNIRNRLYIVLFFVASPVYWYESAVRSDLGSSMVLGTLAIIFSFWLWGNTSNRRSLYVAIVVGLVMSTRAVFAIPVTVLLSALLLPSFTNFVKVSFISFVVFFLTFLPFLIWDYNLFIQHNPLIQHSDKSVPFLVPVSIMVSLFAGMRLKKLSHVLVFAGAVMTLITTLSFIAVCIQKGCDYAIFTDGYDVVYLSVGLPFLLAGSALVNSSFNKEELLSSLNY